MPEFLANLDLLRIAGSLALVVLALVLGRIERVGLTGDLVRATLRSFVQLIAVGYALELIFAADGVFWTLGLLAVMTLVAAWTSAGRAGGLSGALLITSVGIGAATALTLGLLVALDVFDFSPRYIIPVAGMVIGNAMTTISLVMGRIIDDLRGERETVETALALGATGRIAARPVVRRAIRASLVPIIDTTRTVGLIKLPGAMTGMILAGAAPLEAVQIQLVIIYMLVGSTAMSALVAAVMTSSRCFTAAHQLVLPAASTEGSR